MKFSVKKLNPLFKVVRVILKFCYQRTEVIGLESIPEEPLVIVGNHTQMHGPLVCEFYLPDNFYTWCAGEMMTFRDVPAYAYKDFWSEKSKKVRWFYKILSYLIAPLSVLIFNNARAIGVYHDTRILSTFKTTVSKLQNGESIVIFPEHAEEHNHIVCEFTNRFVDIAKMYYKRCGKELLFVPSYIAPSLKKMYIGKGIRFCPDNQPDAERERICSYLMDEITRMAVELPRHKVVPYRNVPKKLYPYNK